MPTLSTLSPAQPRAAILIAALATILSAAASHAQINLGADADFYRRNAGLRTYHLYPYCSSWGPRYDPYHAYTGSNFPYLYQSDGSYYGYGWSGYSDGSRGYYWYW